MLYQLHEMNRTLLSPLIQWAEASSKLFTSPVSLLAHSPFSQRIAAGYELMYRLGKEYEKPENERDIPKLANLETQLSFARNSIANYTNEYTKLLNEQQKISKDLKATREQRIKRIEDGKSSWVGLIRMLEDEQLREKEEMAIKHYKYLLS